MSHKKMSTSEIEMWELNENTFVSSDHASHLLHGLCQLRMKRLLFDISLVVEGKIFSAHKAALAGCSDYFRAMFTDDLKESHQTQITLNGVTSTGITLVLDYIYTASIDINLGNVQDILAAGSHLQLFQLVSACSEYLLSVLDIDNCIDILNLTETYTLKTLHKTVNRFIGQNLTNLSCSSEFHRLSSLQLQFLLENDFPVDCAEVGVLKAVLCWLYHNPSLRSSSTAKLLKCIHFTDISRENFHTLRKSPMFSLLRKANPSLGVCCFTSMWNAYLERTNPLLPDLINTRGFQQAVITVGGFQAGKGLTNEITYYHPHIGIWKNLTTIPHVEQCNFGMAVLKNDLYIIGGSFNGQLLEEQVHPFGFCYNARSDSWRTIAAMHRERCQFYLAAVGNALYAIGGVGDEEEDQSGACEKYQSDTDSWEEIEPSPFEVKRHAGAVMSQCIYVSGGIDRYSFVLDILYCYDTESERWTQKASMLSGRADHSMVAHCDQLYVAGGWSGDEFTLNRDIIPDIDCYDVKLDQWTTVTSVDIPRHMSSLVVISDRLYCIGGLGWGHHDQASGVIDIYDLRQREWLKQKKYPVEIWEHMSAVVYVPTCRDDKEKEILNKHQTLNQ